MADTARLHLVAGHLDTHCGRDHGRYLSTEDREQFEAAPNRCRACERAVTIDDERLAAEAREQSTPWVRDGQVTAAGVRAMFAATDEVRACVEVSRG